MDNDTIDLDDFAKWYEHGVKMGWVTEGFCYTHDGDPFMTDEESQEWEEGGDPCMPVLKVLV